MGRVIRGTMPSSSDAAWLRRRRSAPGLICSETMKLADLIDLEAQLARDRSADPAALEARDTGSFPEAPRDRGALIARWLQGRRDAEPGQLYPGRAVANVLRGFRAALVLGGLVIGWTAATAALLGCLRLIVFSDIAFSWSTTLVQLDAPRFHGLVHALAAPFAWLWPDADPSRALVEATRYSRLEGSYVLSGAGRAARPELVGGWWPFLLASIALYGLLPRCLALGIAAVRGSHLLARLPLDASQVMCVGRRPSEA